MIPAVRSVCVVHQKIVWLCADAFTHPPWFAKIGAFDSHFPSLKSAQGTGTRPPAMADLLAGWYSIAWTLEVCACGRRMVAGSWARRSPTLEDAKP